MVNTGLSVRVRLTATEFGSIDEQEPPPPVQDDAGTVTTGVAAEVETVCVPEQLLPNVDPEQTYVKLPELTRGPPVGVKSEAACIVMLPPPPEVVRAR